jgi:hypothetical protein
LMAYSKKSANKNLSLRSQELISSRWPKTAKNWRMNKSILR